MKCFFSLEAFQAEIKENIEIGMWTASKKKKFRSHIWNDIHEVFDCDDTLIDDAYFCVKCKQGIYNSYPKGNTTQFNRHICFVTTGTGTDKKVRQLIRPQAKEGFKISAANFAAKDLVPYKAIEGEGLFDLLVSTMKFGQQHSKATPEDLRKALPTRNTVRSHLEKEASLTKDKMKKFMHDAKEVGGFAVTSDSWTDNYRGISYICLVAHCNTIGPKGIQQHRFTLYVSEITELVKTKAVIVK